MARGADKDRDAELTKGNIPVPEHTCDPGAACWCEQRPFPVPDWQEDNK